MDNINDKFRKEKIIIPFDSGNATIVPDDGNNCRIIITSNGIKYEFDASPVGIEAFSIDGGVLKKYER